MQSFILECISCVCLTTNEIKLGEFLRELAHRYSGEISDIIQVVCTSGDFSQPSYQLANLVMADETSSSLSGFTTHPFGSITVAKNISGLQMSTSS